MHVVVSITLIVVQEMGYEKHIIVLSRVKMHVKRLAQFECNGRAGYYYPPGPFERYGWCVKYSENACENFTGAVCPDGSCTGFEGE